MEMKTNAILLDQEKFTCITQSQSVTA